MSKLINLFILLMISGSVFAQPEVQLSEKFISEVAAKGAPQIDQIQAAFLSVNLQRGQLNEQFAPELFGRGSYSETNEKPIITFIPIFSPVKTAQLGVRQNLKSGFAAEAAINTDQRSANSAASGKFRDVTTTTLSFTMQMDLWKDLFGRTSKARVESAEMDSKRAQLEKDIQTKTFLISLRRIYWSLVANQESLKISEQLLKTAQRQAAETQRRFKDSVAETDEVAGYNAQVASRQGTLTYLEYQRETLIKQLKNLLPELSESQLKLADYDLNTTFNEVMGCTATIAQQAKVPMNFTQYDEATDLIRKVRVQAKTINSRYSDVDLKLYGTVKSTGVSSSQGANGFTGSYGGSLGDMENNNRSGYDVGLRFSLPLGSVKADNQRTKELYDEKRLSAAIDSNDARVNNTHYQLVSSITLLNEIIRSQKVNSEQLSKRLTHMRKKYVQARASVNDLVQDQDALLNSELATIDTQLQILNVLFDYLAIFTETPCSFNRI